MKTTVDIADSLLKAAKRRADRDGVTLRALVEEGLRRVLSEPVDTLPFKLRRASFRGNGPDSSVQEGSWEQVRTAIYEGRGA